MREKEPMIAIFGLGKMGETIIHHIRKTGLNLLVCVESNLSRGEEVLKNAGINYEMTSSAEKGQKIIEKGGVVLCDKPNIAIDISDVNVIIDATGNIDVGAYIAWQGILNKKNIIMLNAELDATLGPLFSMLSETVGVVYTGDIGDEHGAIMHYLYRPLSQIGLDVVVAGKGKNNPLDRYATPKQLTEVASRSNLNPRVLTSFIDGTKTMIEMTILSNATKLLPDVRGMHGPVADLSDLTKIFRPKSEGGILNDLHVVDYVIGIAPGVFAITKADDEVIVENLKYLKIMGNEPYFLFYRPYHLPGSETILAAIKAVKDNEPVIKAAGYFSDTVAVAKRDISRGEIIDGIGGEKVYGMIERHKEAAEHDMLPIGISEGAILKRNIKRDEFLTFDDVELPQKLVVDLWKIQRRIL